MSLVADVGPKVATSCLVRSCGKQGCRVPLDGAATPRLVMDLDKPGSPLGGAAARCDYLILVDNDAGMDWVVPLELKRGKAPGSVVRQLQAGADLAASLLPRDAKVKVRPVVAARGIHSAAKEVLKQELVRLRGRGEHAKLISCGSPLAIALRS